MGLVVIWQYLRTRLSQRTDQGLVTTETAVLAFVLVGGAIVVAGILIAAATQNANNLPDP